LNHIFTSVLGGSYTLDPDNIKTIITDLDGTLVELRIDYKNAKNESIKMLEGIYPFSNDFFSNINTLSQMYERSTEFLRNIGCDSFIHEINIKMSRIADKYEMDAARRTSIFPGVLSSLKQLRGAGIEVILFTVNGESSVDYLLRRFDIRDYFTYVFHRKLMFNFKHYPNCLSYSLKKNGIDPKRTLIVGDSVIDIMCGKAIGAKTIGITTGMSDYEQLKKTGADFIIKNFQELLSLVQIDSKD